MYLYLWCSLCDIVVTGDPSRSDLFVLVLFLFVFDDHHHALHRLVNSMSKPNTSLFTVIAIDCDCSQPTTTTNEKSRRKRKKRKNGKEEDFQREPRSVPNSSTSKYFSIHN